MSEFLIEIELSKGQTLTDIRAEAIGLINRIYGKPHADYERLTPLELLRQLSEQDDSIVERVAKGIYYSVSSVQDWISGRTEPSARAVDLLGRYFHHEVDGYTYTTGSETANTVLDLELSGANTESISKLINVNVSAIYRWVRLRTETDDKTLNKLYAMLEIYENK